MEVLPSDIKPGEVYTFLFKITLTKTNKKGKFIGERKEEWKIECTVPADALPCHILNVDFPWKVKL